jgi:hypothetical protein
MDQAFFLRAKQLLDQRRPARLDHRMLVAAVVARQAASPSARAAARTGDRESQAAADTLVALLLARPEWRPAATIQRGCFNRAVAARAVNPAETPLTRIFTSRL